MDLLIALSEGQWETQFSLFQLDDIVQLRGEGGGGYRPAHTPSLVLTRSARCVDQCT